MPAAAAPGADRSLQAPARSNSNARLFRRARNPSMSAIAIIGMACRYAEARSPRELWENVLAQRRSFRGIPRVRLNLADYSAETQAEDQITPVMAAVLDDYKFDRARFHVSQDAFLSTDLTHWLALDVAS